jgi:glyoxylase-like metal-dependent hydrolase (beta-lactamase superfamily II)
MNLYTINTGFFKLDGGAMFGVVPRSIWQRSNPADENNLCTWALRCLLIEDGDHLILVDNGIGDKQESSFLRHYYLHGEATLNDSLRKAGFSPTDITDVVLTHLHFDHCGGGVKRNAGKTGFELTFPKARYWSNESHWCWAIHPNPREKASFLSENLLPMQESGHLHFITKNEPSPFPNVDFLFVDGHTEKMMLPKVRFRGRTLVFTADLIPSAGHLPIPYVMGYDVRPLQTMEEKKHFLEEALRENYLLMFEHDPVVECATVTLTEKGIRLGNTGTLQEMLG